MKSKFFLCFRPIVEDSVLHNHAIDRSSPTITKRSVKNDPLFEPRINCRRNRRDKFFKALHGDHSRNQETLVLKGNHNQQREITSIGNLSKGKQSSRPYSYNHRNTISASASASDEIKKYSSSVYLIIFALFATIYFGRVYAIVLTSLWLLLFSLVPKSICRILEKFFIVGCGVQKQSYDGTVEMRVT
ncbi:PREDICTED: uncharacterized protein LOC109228179 [Nicotiana attenuata]|uniref:Uncharacterized protein n=1 Tax=Nicotiana attenuata TaxID=49451 RepID=A0A1J6IVJ0_NICAT|nr:PREDICTED: uncharacterized protein LOC109228179 [Nicotiana attenuata]OIT01735.1 hypothetical protein A4A49_08658 [Nicotiana attenuata]